MVYEPSREKQEAMQLDVQIASIDIIENNILTGQVGDEHCSFGMHPDKDTGDFTIRWSFAFNLPDDSYVQHESATVFQTNGLNLDGMSLQDPRIDLLVQLLQISMSHARMTFIKCNSEITNIIPPMIWRQQLMIAILQQLSSSLN